MYILSSLCKVVLEALEWIAKGSSIILKQYIKTQDILEAYTVGNIYGSKGYRQHVYRSYQKVKTI